MRLVLSLAFIAVWLVNIVYCEDFCSSITVSSKVTAETLKTTLACLNSISTLTDELIADLDKTVTLALSIYSFTDDLADGDHELAWQEGYNLDGTVTLKDQMVDLLAVKNSIFATTTPTTSVFSLFVRLSHLWALAGDAHTSFAPTPVLEYIIPGIPLAFVPTKTNDGMKLRVDENMPVSYQVELAKYLSVNILGKTVDTINGVNAFVFLSRYGDHHHLTGRDPAQRLDSALSGLAFPAWHAVLGHYKTGAVDWTQVDLADSQSLQDTLLAHGWELGLTDGSKVTVPYLLLISSGYQVGQEIYKAPLTSETLSSLVTTSINTDYSASCPATEARGLAPARALAARSRVQFLHPEDYGMRPIEQENDPAASAQVATSLLDPAQPPVQIGKTLGDLGFDVYKSRMKGVVDVEPVLKASGATIFAKQYGNYMMLQVDDTVCSLVITTFAPNIVTFVNTHFPSVTRVAANHKCGVAGGRKLVVDLRSNGGGYVSLADFLIETMFFTASPPVYFSPTACTSDNETSGLMAACFLKHVDDSYLAGIREIDDTKVIEGCETAGQCPNWPFTRVTTRTVNSKTKKIVNPVLMSSLYWENTEDTYENWYTKGGAQKVAGTRLASMGVLAERARNEWFVDKTMTYFVFGPNSASATGMVASRVLAHQLGTVITVGGLPDFTNNGRLLTAMVPGGNVYSYQDLAKLTRGPALPFLDTDISLSTLAVFAPVPSMRPANDPYKPMEFVKAPPHHVMLYWDSPLTRNNSDNLMTFAHYIVDQLKNTCVAGFYGGTTDTSKCDEGTQVCGFKCNGSSYNGEVGAVACKFGYMNVDGKCKHLFTPRWSPYDHLPKKSNNMAIIIAVLVVVAALIVVVIVVFALRKFRSSRVQCKVSNDIATQYYVSPARQAAECP